MQIIWSRPVEARQDRSASMPKRDENKLSWIETNASLAENYPKVRFETHIHSQFIFILPELNRNVSEYVMTINMHRYLCAIVENRSVKHFLVSSNTYLIALKVYVCPNSD